MLDNFDSVLRTSLENAETFTLKSLNRLFQKLDNRSKMDPPPVSHISSWKPLPFVSDPDYAPGNEAEADQMEIDAAEIAEIEAVELDDVQDASPAVKQPQFESPSFRFSKLE